MMEEAVVSNDTIIKYSNPSIDKNCLGIHKAPVEETDSESIISLINNAISLNIRTEQRLMDLQNILNERLHECRARLYEIQNPTKLKQMKTFNYRQCAAPYFKDKKGNPPPDNDDTLKMNKLQMYNLCSLTNASWTVKDKVFLNTSILKICQQLKRTEIKNAIMELEKNQKVILKSDDWSRISFLKKEFNNVRKKDLNDIVQPIEYEYNWDLIARQGSYRHSPQAYRNFWKSFLHPSINKNSFSKLEHSLLHKVAKKYNFQDWDSIADELGANRTPYQYFVYYRTLIENRISNSKWSDQETAHLIQLVKEWNHGGFIPWAKIASALGNRTRLQVYQKYVALTGKRKGRFSAEEDAVILTGIKKFGNNYRKIQEYLPDRSILQVLRRSQLISGEPRISTTWTVEEDRSLLKLTGSQDYKKLDFSSLTKYFPGKDRTHLRTRFNTLSKWLKKFPNRDVSLAPRRTSRCLRNVKTCDDLSSAVELLKNPSPPESILVPGPKTKITLNSSEQDIDAAIVMHLHSVKSRLRIDSEEFDITRTPINMQNLHNLLILLKARLNKLTFLRCTQSSDYNELLQFQCKTKTFSKEEHDAGPDIWGSNTLKSEHVLPPNFDTIVGCKKLMNYYNCDSTPIPILQAYEFLEKPDIMEQYELLLYRIKILFIWPMLLSNITPEIFLEEDT